MRIHHNYIAATFLGLVVLTSGCKDSTAPAPPVMGTIEVAVSTVSANGELDSDGYTVRLDNGAAHPVAINSALTISDVPLGNHYVGIYGLAANCTVAGANPYFVSVTTDKTASTVVFSVTCWPPEDECGWYYCYYSIETPATTEMPYPRPTRGRPTGRR